MREEKSKNVWYLIVAQAFFLSSSMTNVSFAGLAGKMLAADPKLATVPLSLVIVSTALTTGPFSMLMQHKSRRFGFMLGSMLGILSAAVCAYAVRIGSFDLFCVGTFLMGPYFASAQYYRFAASESVPKTHAARAISLVLLGGLIAALMVPTANAWFNEHFMPYTFMGVYIFVGIMAALSIVPILLMAPIGSPAHYTPEDASGEEGQKKGRPLSEIVKDRTFLVAVTNGIAGYAMMTFVMTATPLAMEACGFGSLTSSHVIQGHVIAMFLPSLFTGQLIARFGVMKILLVGQACFALAFITALSGIEVQQFSIALVLLGVGWNFCFVGGSHLLTTVHTEAEKGRVQGLNEFIVFAVSAAGSLASGFILNEFGWTVVNQVTFAILAVAAAVTVIHVLKTRNTVESL
ncbi:MFS transporter [Kordiimonas sediminis]|nr:MFS transporter [Kordiimonas sediminis]